MSKIGYREVSEATDIKEERCKTIRYYKRANLRTSEIYLMAYRHPNILGDLEQGELIPQTEKSALITKRPIETWPVHTRDSDHSRDSSALVSPQNERQGMVKLKDIKQLIAVELKDYKECIDSIEHNQNIKNLKTNLRFHHLKFDGNGRPMSKALAEILYQGGGKN